MKTARRPKTVRQAVRDGAAKFIASHTAPNEFLGSHNPRHLRVLALLLARPARREEVDRVAGAANGPDLVSDLRALGLDVLCSRVPSLDRDGRRCRPGVYSLSVRDQRMLAAWQASRHPVLPPVTPDLFGEGAAP